MKLPRIDFEISVSDAESATEAAFVSEQLRLYVEKKFAPADKKPFLAIAKNPGGEVIGGIRGLSHWRWLYIQHLWVAEAVRSMGLGRELLAAAENEAKKRGNLGLYVDTFEVKTRDFYVRNGFREVGKIPNFPEGAQRFFLAKALEN